MAIGTTAALIGGTVAASAIGASSANKAAKAQESAAKDSNAVQRYIFDRSVELAQPQQVAGRNALAALQGELGIGAMPAFSETGKLLRATGADDGNFYVQYQNPDGNWQNVDRTFGTLADANAFVDQRRYGGFQETPGYQFAVDEGQNALAKMMAARGMRLGGAAGKEAMRFGTGLANQEYGNYINRLGMMAGMGQAANTQQIQAGQNYANNYGINAMAAGQARASGYQGVNAAAQSGINNLFSIYGMKQAGFFQ